MTIRLVRRWKVATREARLLGANAASRLIGSNVSGALLGVMRYWLERSNPLCWKVPAPSVSTPPGTGPAPDRRVNPIVTPGSGAPPAVRIRPATVNTSEEPVNALPAAAVMSTAGGVNPRPLLDGTAR